MTTRTRAVFDNTAEEALFGVATIQVWLEEGLEPQQIAVYVANDTLKTKWERTLSVELPTGNLIPVLIVSETVKAPFPKRVWLPELADWFITQGLENAANHFSSWVEPLDWVTVSYSTHSLSLETELILEKALVGWSFSSPAGPQADLKIPSIPSENPSPWLQYQPTAAETVWNVTETLTVSPSTVEMFLNCPRQFFYYQLLGLREAGTISPQAQVGTLIHKLLEVFNRHYQHDYTPMHLNTLANQIFDWDTHESRLETLGLRRADLAFLSTLSPLQQQYLKQDILAAFADLAQTDYFQRPFTQLHVEARYSADNIAGIQGLQLKGRFDLIREKPDGTLEIVDYKTSKSQYTAVREETNLQALRAALEPIDWETTSPPDATLGRAYQLPLYWLMTQQLPAFANHPTDIRIQMVRPQAAGSKFPGAITLLLPHQDLEKSRPYLIELLQKGVLDPIRTQSHFEPLGDPDFQCAYCAYAGICEGPEEAHTKAPTEENEAA